MTHTLLEEIFSGKKTLTNKCASFPATFVHLEYALLNICLNFQDE